MFHHKMKHHNWKPDFQYPCRYLHPAYKGAPPASQQHIPRDGYLHLVSLSPTVTLFSCLERLISTLLSSLWWASFSMSCCDWHSCLKRIRPIMWPAEKTMINHQTLLFIFSFSKTPGTYCAEPIQTETTSMPRHGLADLAPLLTQFAANTPTQKL